MKKKKPKIVQRSRAREPWRKYDLDAWMATLIERTAKWQRHGRGEQPALELTQGVDFDVTPQSMRHYFYRYEMPVSIDIIDKTLFVYLRNGNN